MAESVEYRRDKECHGKVESKKIRVSEIPKEDRTTTVCITDSSSRILIVTFLNNSVSSPLLSLGIWLCARKEFETAGLEAGHRVPHALSPAQGPGSPWFPCKSKRPRGPGSAAQGPDAPAMTSSPVSRVVYNGKRNSSPRSPPSSTEIFTPAHEENVRFIYEAWQGVERDLRSQMSGSERGLVEEYVEKVPNPSLKTFKPIDLSDLKRRNTPDAKKS
ncbi:Mapk-regulated corepressor-interacting protein 1 [Vulpes lagopus]